MPVEEQPEAAVLLSGGLDSAVLCVELLGAHSRVHPLYIRCGLLWEDVELAGARAFLAEVRHPRLQRLALLDEPVRDVYGRHWSTAGQGVPGSETPDDAVYLPGRNLLLTVKASIWCRLRDIGTLALGCLGSNPFPDSTPAFFDDLHSVLSRAMSGSPRLIRPLERLQKKDVVLRGKHLPLHLTFSCIAPVDGLHCGRCNKCAERRLGFQQAGVVDQTRYAGGGEPPS